MPSCAHVSPVVFHYLLTYWLKGLFLEAVSDNIGRGMGVIGSQHPSQLFLELLFSKLKLVVRFDELSWTKIVTLSIIIVSITKTIFILYTRLNQCWYFRKGNST